MCVGTQQPVSLTSPPTFNIFVHSVSHFFFISSVASPPTDGARVAIFWQRRRQILTCCRPRPHCLGWLTLAVACGLYSCEFSATFNGAGCHRPSPVGDRTASRLEVVAAVHLFFVAVPATTNHHLCVGFFYFLFTSVTVCCWLVGCVCATTTCWHFPDWATRNFFNSQSNRFRPIKIAKT